MLFLMNDVVLDLDTVDLAPPAAAERYRRLSLDYVSSLGRELFAEHPLLQCTAPERAARLAVMIMAKSPDINAALFVAPSYHCPVDQVSVRYTQIGLDVMGVLYNRQQAGKLTNVVADREVWRRLAA
jgi:hypothetical protein